jgi:hypothetical protein
VVKKFLILMVGLVANLVASECSAADVNRYELNVGDFTTLAVDDNVNVVYKCSTDSAGLAVYDATKEAADKLIFDLSKKGRLLIQTNFLTEEEKQIPLPVVTVYSKFLSRVQNSGDSTLKVVSVAACPEFKAAVIGNGNVVIKDINCTKFHGSIKTGNGQLIVTGKCDSAALNNTGVGSIQADGLEAKDASCRFFGTGTTGVWATDTLSIKGMFPGKLYYKVAPKKIRNYSMGVKVYSMDDMETPVVTEQATEKTGQATENED